MSDLLAIFDQHSTDDELVDQIARRHPHRVTVLVEGAPPDWATDDSGDNHVLRDRLAALMAVIEQRTGAAVVGLVGSRAHLQGWRFDRVVGGRPQLAAV